MKKWSVIAGLVCLFHATGCHSEESGFDAQAEPVAQEASDTETPRGTSEAAVGPAETPDASGPRGPAAVDAPLRPSLCERPGDDPVRDVFCGDPPPNLSSLVELRGLLRAAAGLSEGAAGSVPGSAESVPAVVLGHSTSLSGHLVSPINPRVLLVEGDTLLAFQRGVQRIEIATQSRVDATRSNFYLVSFKQDCNTREPGCTPGDLYTDRIERDWREVELQDDEDLKNTATDCRQCHQRGLEKAALLMRELQGPWTHFFSPAAAEDAAYPGVSGGDLVRDYLAAKGDEGYGSIGSIRITQTLGLLLQTRVTQPQPLLFDSPSIERERWPYGPEGYPDEPQRSPTWDRAFEAFKRGENLALPYFDARPTDPDKQAALTEAYQRYLRGELAAEALPDLADIFPDDPQVRAEIGLQVEPGATPAQALVQACGSCHNDVLDQDISRARFSIDLAGLDRAELDLAIARLQMPPDHPGVMPPAEARELPEDIRLQVIAYLREATWTPEDQAFLAAAARAGMAGNAPSDNAPGGTTIY